MLVMLLVSAIGVAMTDAASTELAISVNGQHAAQAFYAADSGLEQIKVDLLEDSTWVAQILNVGTMTLRSPFPDSFTINGHAVTVSQASGEVVPGYYSLGTATGLGDASYSREVLLPGSTEPANAKGSRTEVALTIRSTGAAGSYEAGSQVVRADSKVILLRTTPWDNAIFAGGGADDDPLDRLRDGVEIRGSVHVLGGGRDRD